MLKTLELALIKRLISHKESASKRRSDTVPHISESFQKAGKRSKRNGQIPTCGPKSLLDGTTDWKLLVDFDTDMFEREFGLRCILICIRIVINILIYLELMKCHTMHVN